MRIKILTGTNPVQLQHFIESSICHSTGIIDVLSEQAQQAYNKMFPSKEWQGAASLKIQSFMFKVQNAINDVYVGFPETGLHESQINTFINWLVMARPDIQVVIVTLSEVVLNTIRVAVANGIIKHNEVEIVFYNPTPIVIPLLPHGKIEQWEEGFFDLTEQHYTQLFGL